MLPGAILILLLGAGTLAAAVPPMTAPDARALAEGEAAALAGAGGLVRRAGDHLVVRTARGRLILRDHPTEGEGSRRYRFVSLLRQDSCALVAQFGWESWGYRLVHLPSARILELDGLPVLTQDSQYAVVASLDLDAHYARNSLAVLGFTDRGVRQVFFHDFGEDAGPAEPVWKDDRTVTFRWYRREPGASEGVVTATQGRLELRNGRWVLR